MGNKYLGSTAGLTVVSDAGLARITSSWNSGIMTPDTKGCWLASTDASDLVDTNHVVNGSFDVDTSGWLANGATLTHEAGRMKATTTNIQAKGATQDVVLTDGPGSYEIIATIENIDAEYVQIRVVNTDWTTATLSEKALIGETKTVRVIRSTDKTTQRVVFDVFHNTETGHVGYLDDVIVRKLDDDRSVNNKGLTVHGTVARTPVAPGAELMGYGPFSGTDYLEQPYNPDLDFGTGDFSVVGWANTANTNNATIFERGAVGSTANRYGLYINGGEFKPFLGTGILDGGGASFNAWEFLAVVRRNGVLEFYRRGQIVGSLNNAQTQNSVTNPAANMWVGINAGATGTPLSAGRLALWKPSATAPTPEQLAKWYREEKKLFQPGAACTLYGNSDAVTALAHCDIDGLTRAGTGDGLSRFDGLLRVSHKDTPVLNTIACGAGYEVTQ